MPKYLRVIIGVLILLMIIIQFIPSELPATQKTNVDDLRANAVIPVEVDRILRTSCYDCHSNESVYPWYSYVAPVSWLVSRDVIKGREELNFSLWQQMSKRDKIKYLGEIAEEVEGGFMPLPVYTIMHSDARLDEVEKQELVDWTQQYSEIIIGE